MTELVTRNYWWLGVIKNIGKYMERCDMCQRIVICRSTCPENYIPVVMSPLKNTSPPFMVATFLTTCLMAVLQLSGYSVFHDGNTPIQLGLP